MEPTQTNEKEEALIREVATVLNKYSQENRSNTPDFMLSEFMLGCLNVYENTIVARNAWYSRTSSPTVPIKGPLPGEAVDRHLKLYGHLPTLGCCEFNR